MKRREIGAALLTALALLMIFSILGAAYLKFMVIDAESTAHDVLVAQAQAVANGGVYAAIGEIGAALAAGKAPAGKLDIEYPIYDLDRDDSHKLVARELEKCKVTITVSDECARVNLNFAPTRVLEAVLGVDGNTARRIRSSLPRQDELTESVVVTPGQRQWFASVEELVTRGFMADAAFAKINPNLLTVCSVPDLDNPSGFINVNSAPPEVLAAVLGISIEAAQPAIAKRPFTSVNDLAAAAGKDPAAFTVHTAPDVPGTLPKELTLQSRCYRVESRAAVTRGPTELIAAERGATAIIWFKEGGSPEIVYWNGSYEQPADEVSTAGPDAGS
ncbi:MAG: general secretion pathway protein GspK [Candidatus Hydrogenedentes bacterium]|nr:general secretion pathway protein GspK [Candidatus Hydrogenedentota bacterium]